MGKGVEEEAILLLCFLMCDRRFFSSRRKEAKAAQGPPSLHEEVAAPGPPYRMGSSALASQGAIPTPSDELTDTKL